MRIKDIKDKIIEKLGELTLIEETSGFVKTFKNFPVAIVKYRGCDTSLLTTGRHFQEEHKFEASILIRYGEDELTEEFFVEITENILDKFYEDSVQTLDGLVNILRIDSIEEGLTDEEQKIKEITVNFTAVVR